MKRKITPIAGLSLVLGLAFDVLLYGKVPGVSVFLYICLILGGMFYLEQRFRAAIGRSVYGLAVAVAFFSGMVFVRANPFLAVMNILLVLFLLLLIVRVAGWPGLGLRNFRIAQYIEGMAWLPLRFLQEAWETLQREIRSRSSKASRDTYAPILRGLLISIPLLIIFSLLLSSADLVFQQMLGNLVDFRLPSEGLFRSGLVLFVTSLFVGAYALIFIRADSAPAFSAKNKKSSLSATESSIVLGSVGLLFLVFVLIQVTYLFGGSQHIASTGYTYAEYARKGFFELIAVAVISLLLIWRLRLRTAFRNARQTLAFRWMSGALIVEVMVIMLSAHMRLNLYEEAYGFTTMRLLSHLFVMWLAAVFVFLALYIVREEREEQFAFRTFVSVLAFFALINLINPDAFIARRNIERFNNTGKVDLYYLRNLSEDATPTIAGLLKHKNQDLQKNAANILYSQERATRNRAAHWQSANLARSQAIGIFDDNAAQIEAGKNHHEFDKFDPELSRNKGL